MLREKTEQLLKNIKCVLENRSKDNTLPGNVFYLNDDEILCLPREGGESKFPYQSDGLRVWAYSTGFIQANESLMTIFQGTRCNEEAAIDFFGGVPLQNGEFFPISVTGASTQLFEPFNVDRYVVFGRNCAYYIADVEELTFVMRLHVSAGKEIHFAFEGYNKGDDEKEFYLATYLEPIMGFSKQQVFWDRPYIYGNYYKNGSVKIRTRINLRDDINLLVSNRTVKGDITAQYHTVARDTFVGIRGRGIRNALCLKNGKYGAEIDAVNTTDFPIISDMIHFKTEPSQSALIEYSMNCTHTDEEAEKLIYKVTDLEKVNAELEKLSENMNESFEGMTIRFDKLKDETVSPKLLTRFLRNVQIQADSCAFGKDYGGVFLGVRDVFQQLEAALMWNPERAREKIIDVLGNIFDSGRPPRSISTSASKTTMPVFDVDLYIDQGLWIISTLYTYLNFTDDYSILQEPCGYYILLDEKKRLIAKSDEITTVLEHLTRITDFLLSYVDKTTGCLRICKGDWNDAINGLGKSSDPNEEYGSGVTVMGTEQLYNNLSEMSEILKKVGGYDNLVEEYKRMREVIAEGLMKYAVDIKGNERRIIHAWGDKREHLIGSFTDCDGRARHSVLSNAWWVIGGMLERDITLKQDILEAYKALESKYGYKTFMPAFYWESRPIIGRMACLTPGIYENACCYVHAATFAIMSLFIMGEAKLGWREIMKALPCTHDNVSLSPFVMPNSYVENAEYNMDGESLSDWNTGSAPVIIKTIVRYGFGIEAVPDGILIRTPGYMPADSAELKIKIKNSRVTYIYKNENRGKRRYYINGAEVKGTYDEMLCTEKIFIKTGDMEKEIIIKVTD